MLPPRRWRRGSSSRVGDAHREGRHAGMFTWRPLADHAVRYDDDDDDRLLYRDGMTEPSLVKRGYVLGCKRVSR